MSRMLPSRRRLLGAALGAAGTSLLFPPTWAAASGVGLREGDRISAKVAELMAQAKK